MILKKKDYSLIWQGADRFPLERLDKCAVMIQRGKSVNYGNAHTQVIKSGQARGYMDFDFSQRYYVDDSFVVDERNLQKGDLLINSTGVGTAGRVTLFDIDGDYVVDSHITIVRLNKEKVLPKYALYALATIGFKTIESMANGQSGQIELSLPTIGEIKIPVPPINTIQNEIVSKIEKIEIRELDYRKQIEALRLQIKHLFSALGTQPTERIRLSDPKKFDISIGKRVLKSELVPNGRVPVYSANVFQPFGRLDNELITDFSKPSIIWGIDGDWMVNFVPENIPFYPTDHCGVLRVLTEEIVPRYLAEALNSEGIEAGFSRNYRASIERIKNISVSIPSVSEQKKTIDQIEPLEKAIREIEVALVDIEYQKEHELLKYL